MSELINIASIILGIIYFNYGHMINSVPYMLLGVAFFGVLILNIGIVWLNARIVQQK